MSETRLRYVLIRVERISDVDRSLIASKIEAKEDSAGIHPVLLFRAGWSKGDYAAIVGTTDREGKRLTDPSRYHTALASANPALNHDTHFDVANIYLISEEKVMGQQIRLMGRLSKEDTAEIVERVAENIDQKNIVQKRGDLVVYDPSRERTR